MLTFAELADHAFATFVSKDLPAVMALFAEDAVVIDPHYPQPTMQGKAAIQQGLAWAFGNMVQPGFTVLHTWTDENQTSGAVEIATDHRFRGGMRVQTAQVFVVDTRDGLITRLQSFPSYGPPGIVGTLTRATRFTWRLRGKLR